MKNIIFCPHPPNKGQYNQYIRAPVTKTPLNSSVQNARSLVTPSPLRQSVHFKWRCYTKTNGAPRTIFSKTTITQKVFSQSTYNFQ